MGFIRSFGNDHMLKYIFSFLLLSLLGGCTEESEQSVTFSESEIQSSISVFMNSLRSAAVSKNLDEFMEFWARDDSTLYTRHGRTFIGWDEIRNDHSTAFSGSDVWTSDSSQLFTQVLSASSAVSTSFSLLSAQQPDGTTQSTWFTITATLKLFPEGWKIVQAHSSYPPTGMTPLGVPEE